MVSTVQYKGRVEEEEERKWGSGEYSVRAEWRRRRRGGSVKRLAAYLAIISLHGVKISSSALRCQEIRWGEKGGKDFPPCRPPDR